MIPELCSYLHVQLTGHEPAVNKVRYRVRSSLDMVD